MALWLKDRNGDFVGTAFDISIGLTQIKPVTAQTASQPVAFSGRTSLGAGKADVVAALWNDGDNLRACALILALYQMQWDAGAPESQIGDRPDIVATLFQIGFERSHPKSNPQSNAFGRQVQAAYDSEWMRAAFR